MALPTFRRSVTKHSVLLIVPPALFVLFANVAIVQPVAAQEGPSNWMREYARLQVEAKNRSVLGGRAPMWEAPIPLRIVGGTIADDQDNPFQVALLDKSIADNYYAQYCGGTLIRSNVVVTAAHCSFFVSPEDVQVLTGTRNLDGTGTRRAVSTIAIHPQWNRNTLENDVAVWTLASHAEGIEFASLATSDGSVDDNLLATGWGDTTQGGTFPIALRRVELPLVSRMNCNDANSYDGYITEDMLCAGFDGGGMDTCQGDSGGPLTWGADNTVLMGITSWGYGCAQPNLFGVYTRVSNESIRNFIAQAASQR